MQTKKKVLVVDDDSALRRLVQEVLTQSGEYEVLEADDGAAGLEIAFRERPDLLLLDMLMPRVDGGEVLAIIKAAGTLDDTVIILLTGVVTKEESDARGGLIGQYPILAKPVTPSQLLQCVQQHLKT